MNAKTLFAALAATSMLTVFGDFENAVDFERYHNIGDTLTNGNDDEGFDTGVGNAYFLYQGDENNSVVTNTLGSYTSENGVPKSGLQNKSLYVDTSSGTLFRGVNHLADASTLGDSTSFFDKNIYVDTLVQFTVTEDDEPTPESGDKLAIWLNANSNLCVKAGYIVKDTDTNNITLDEDPKTYELNGTVIPGTWYRLTVEAIGNVGDTGIAGFKIYIDGECVGTATAAANYDVDVMKSSDSWIVFPSLVNNKYLTAVGFRGTGAVDDLLITDIAPTFLVNMIDFTLTWMGNVTAIKLTIDGGDATTFTVDGAGSTNLSINAGRNVEILYADVTTTEGDVAWNTDNSAANSITAAPKTKKTWDDTLNDGEGGWTYPVVGYTYTIADTGAYINLDYTGLTPTVEDWVPDSSTIAANTSAADQYPSLAGTALASVDAKALTDWANNETLGNSVSLSDVASAGADSTIAKAFMLNCANTADAVADAEEDFKEDITITMVDGVPQVSYSGTYNVTPQMKGSNDITDSNSWTNVSGASTDYKFYKFVLSL